MSEPQTDDPRIVYLRMELHYNPPGDKTAHGMYVRWLLDTPHGTIKINFRKQVDLLAARKGWILKGR